MSFVALTVGPVFATVALGYAAARVGWFTREAGAGLTRFMYYFAIPAMLFQSLATAALPPEMPWRFLAAYYLPALLVFVTARQAARSWLGWESRDAAIAGMGAAYSNMVLLGLPLVVAAFGDTAALPLFVLLATQSLVFFPLTTLLIESSGAVDDAARTGRRRALAGLALNPVLVSLGLGLACNFGAVAVPELLTRVISPLAAAAPACALIALGLSLAHYRERAPLHEVSLLVVAKTVVQPAAVWGCGAWLGVRPDWLAVATLLAAMPCSVNAFLFSAQYGIRENVIARAVVVSTVLCVASASLLLAIIGRAV